MFRIIFCLHWTRTWNDHDRISLIAYLHTKHNVSSIWLNNTICVPFELCWKRLLHFQFKHDRNLNIRFNVTDYKNGYRLLFSSWWWNHRFKLHLILSIGVNFFLFSGNSTVFALYNNMPTGKREAYAHIERMRYRKYSSVAHYKIVQ